MGMYTEILVKARLNDAAKKDEQVMSVIEYLFDGGDIARVLPEHELFSLPRWSMIGKSSSFYHHPEVISCFYTDYDSAYIFSRSDIKNYDGEIEAFFDWLRPHCDAHSDECIGYTWYEEDLSPTLVFRGRP